MIMWKKSIERTSRWANVDWRLTASWQGLFRDCPRWISSSAVSLLKIWSVWTCYSIGAKLLGKLWRDECRVDSQLRSTREAALSHGSREPRQSDRWRYSWSGHVDCVLPTRLHEMVPVWLVKRENAQFAEDFTPLDPEWLLHFKNYTRAYLRHLPHKMRSFNSLDQLPQLVFLDQPHEAVRQAIMDDSLWIPWSISVIMTSQTNF